MAETAISHTCAYHTVSINPQPPRRYESYSLEAAETAADGYDLADMIVFFGLADFTDFGDSLVEGSRLAEMSTP